MGAVLNRRFIGERQKDARSRGNSLPLWVKRVPVEYRTGASKKCGAACSLNREAAECRAEFERSFAQDNTVLDAEQRLPILMRKSWVLNGKHQQDDSIALLDLHFLRLHRQLRRMLQVARTTRGAFARSKRKFGL